ncbi:MAG TPA: type II toxin-antitoxin system HicA family toxin [Chloroflexia bacterium]|nr:type II toxin-antitoxin system HicA family toxin [Chloroflexia bacterium]
MPRLPRASGKEVLQALQREGFQLSHVRGSHHYLKQPGVTALVVVPIHGNQPLPTGPLRSILKQAGLTTEDLIRLLES